MANGDQNTRYYHMRKVRRRHKIIVMLKIDQGDWIKEENDLRIHFIDYHMKLLKIGVGWRERI